MQRLTRHQRMTDKTLMDWTRQSSMSSTVKAAAMRRLARAWMSDAVETIHADLDHPGEATWLAHEATGQLLDTNMTPNWMIEEAKGLLEDRFSKGLCAGRQACPTDLAVESREVH